MKMKKVVGFPDSAAVREEAIAWLSRLDGDDALSLDERAQLGEWLRRSPAHRELLHYFADLWGKMNVLTELAVPLGQTTQPDRARSRGWKRSLGLAAVAASVVIGITVSSFFWTGADPVTESNGLIGTAIGEQQSTTLSDGSVVLLNTNTEIRANYDQRFRDVHLLQGEAHFTVAENPGKPFRVFAGTGRIDAVGTAFSVYLREDAVDVTVTEGRVALASVSLEREPAVDGTGGFPVMPTAGRVEKALGSLKAGQVATIPAFVEDPLQELDVLARPRDVEIQDLSRRMSWTEGVLLFSGESLEDVVKEISRYTTVNIEFSEPAVGAIRVGGTFPVGETDTMFSALETTFGLRVTYLSDTHVLVSAGNQ